MIGLLAAAVALAATQQPTTFAVGVESVYVDVFVTDSGGPIAGLSAADFELRDDGVARPVELVSAESQPLTTVLVLDTSGSVAGEKLAELRTACRALLASLHGEPVGLLTFSE